MKNILMFVLFATVGALAQPTIQPLVMLNADANANLGTRMRWSEAGVDGFEAYHYENSPFGYGPCPSTVPRSQWVQINATMLPPTQTSFDSFEQRGAQFGGPDPFGADGSWCYGVSSVKGGIEGPIVAFPERMLLGQYPYMRFCLQTAPYVTCNTHNGPKSLGQKVVWTVTRTRNGVPESIPVHQVQGPTGSYLYFAFFRFKSHDKVTATATVNGVTYSFTNFVGPNNNPSAARGYVRFNIFTADQTKPIGHQLVEDFTSTTRFRTATPLE